MGIRRFSGWVAGWLSLGISLLFGQHVAEGGPPNVVVILADDLGYSDLGCYGSEIATPNLDRLAAGGLRYTQFYNTARCWPTRGALLTGHYAQQIHRDKMIDGKGGAAGQRPAWARLIPQLLEPLGYRSYMSGKWHVDGSPMEHGFDRAYVIDDHDRYHNPKRHSRDGKPLPPVQPDSGFYLTTAIADHAIECLQEHAAEHADQPFFHYLTFTAPHFPLHALPEDIAKYASRYDVGWDAIRQQRYLKQRGLGLVNCLIAPLEPTIGPPYHFPEALENLGAGEVNRELPWAELNAAQQQFQAAKMEVHAAMIDRMDQEIGRVLQQLKDMSAFEDTLILFLSDNGTSAEIMVRGDKHDPEAAIGSAKSFVCLGPGWSRVGNTPFRRHKTWVHEGGISTPLIAHWPKGIQARGELRTRVGHVVDIAPTIVQLAGGTWPSEREGNAIPYTPGKSLVKSFSDAADARDTSLWWLHEGNRALRSSQWKVVAAKDEPWQLYDLSVDRSEFRDLSDERPEVLKRLVAEWEGITAQIARDLKPSAKK